MILNEMLLGGYQSASTNEISRANANSSSRNSRTSSSTFDMILGSKASSMSNERQVSSKKYDNFASTNRDYRESFTFKNNKKINCAYSSVKPEAKSNSLRDVSSMKECKEDKADNNLDSDDKSEKGLSNDLICAISQILGINADKLQQLLAEAGISPEMLLKEALASGNLTGLDSTSAQLSQLLGLNSEQQQTLSQIIQMAGDTLSGAKVSSEKLLNSDIIAHMGNDIEPDAMQDLQKNGEGRLEDEVSLKLSDIIRERLDELSKKLDGNELEATEEIKRLIEPMAAKVNGLKISNDSEKDGMELAADSGKVTGDSAVPEENTSKTENEQSKNGNSESESFSAPIEQKQENVDNIQLQSVFTELQNKVNVVQGTESLPAKMSMEAKEILSQVIEKASVEITGGKSEMSIELKPESLGKISLKVVTENGIVMAKFVAENQQVKEVLESNMHLLKDSLESQGMNVQGFSVSVGQDSNRHKMNWEKQNDSRRSVTHGASATTSSLLGEIVDFSRSGSMIDPYQWESSTINLKA